MAAFVHVYCERMLNVCICDVCVCACVAACVHVCCERMLHEFAFCDVMCVCVCGCICARVL